MKPLTYSRMKKHLVIPFLAVALNCGATTPLKKNPQLLTQPSLVYPEVAKKEGHQGTVKIRLSINAEGAVDGAEVVESSKSALLDAAAIELTKSWNFSPAIDSEGHSVSTKALVPIEYVKDSIADLPSKTCSDFNSDVKWFKSVYPDKPIAEMRIYNLSLGALVVGSGSTSQMIEISKKFKKAYEKTLVRCADKPDENYWVNIKSNMSSWF
jgi:TonB family protein